MQNNLLFRSFKITDLLGFMDYTVELSENETISIITAPNGYGKTTLLKTIYYFYQNIDKLFEIDFSSIEVVFKNEDKLIVEKKEKQSENNYVPKEKYLDYKFFTGGRGRPKKHSVSQAEIKELKEETLRHPHLSPRQLEQEFPNFVYTGGGRFKNIITEEVVSYGNLVQLYNMNNTRHLPVWLQKYMNLGVMFIETQRLLDQENDKTVEVVKKYANDLSHQIKNTITKAALMAQSLDRTFPKRLLENSDKAPHAQIEIKTLFSELEKKRKSLIDVGIMEKDTTPYSLRDEKITDCQSSVLSFYADDIDKKLQVYDDLYRKIKLFKDICDKKFHFKEIHISQNRGYFFTSKKTNRSLPLPLSELSSGEQHELILIYKLIFLTKPGTLVLIDEPELSLHVAWQIEYIPEIENINSINSFHALIATHSPQIINGRWNLVQELQRFHS